MDILVTLGALGQEALLPAFVFGMDRVRPITGASIARLGRGKGVRFAIGILTGGVEVGFMTLEAEERFVLFQKVVGHRPVRIVTNGAILDYRFVLENEWTLIAGVTSETEIVQPFLGAQHTRDGVARPVGIVTIITAHLAIFHRVTGDEIHFGLDIPVTLTAKFEFVLGQELRIGVVVDLVTICTSNLVFSVLGTKPVHGFATLVASQADGRSFFSFETLFTKAEDLLRVSAFINVGGAGPVTAFATSLVARGLVGCQP